MTEKDTISSYFLSPTRHCRGVSVLVKITTVARGTPKINLLLDVRRQQTIREGEWKEFTLLVQ